jgi:hypothetical protein
MNADAQEREAIRACLAKFIAQRSGIDARDYFSDWRDKDGIAALRSDQFTVRRDGQEARRLLSYVHIWTVDPRHLKSAFRGAFAGRLSWDGKGLDYTPGQYFATEYRAAACAVLALAIWRHWREDCGVSDVRERAKREFGRGIASRWFN